MAKQLTPDAIALTPRERVLLFCAGSSTDWKRAGIMSETVTSLIVRGLLVRDGVGRLTLTNSGPRCIAGAVAGAVRSARRGFRRRRGRRSRARVAVTAFKMARDQVRLAETENRAKKKLVSITTETSM